MVKQMRERVLATLMILAMVVILMPALTLPTRALTTGTTDGTYDFGELGAGGSGGGDYKKLGDKFIVSRAFVQFPSDTFIFPNDADGVNDHGASVDLVIKAEGTTVNKKFTFKDMNLSTEPGGDGDNTLDIFTITFKDTIGNTIAQHTLQSNIQVPDTGINISQFPFTQPFPANGYDNVSEIDITCSYVTNYFCWLDFNTITIANVSAVAAPKVTDANISISGATGTSGAYKIGDTVMATWNNTASGDNNGNITSVNVDFSQFGGGTAVAATNNYGTWTATYTIVAGAIDATGRNVSVTATDDDSNSTTTADTTNATVDNIAPTVTDARISISGATGTGGTFKIGDTVTATWNNTTVGDNNSDTISSVNVNFSQFGGGAAVAATNYSGTWMATYTIVVGTIDATNRNVAVTATDNAGNATTTADTTNATVDNIAPTVTDARISISGATGTGGTFKIGDTVTATWNNTTVGDNNSDTISGVNVNFSQFGGGAAVAATNYSGTWMATYTIVVGTIDATNRNVSFTVADNAGNTTTTADTTNTKVDNIPPMVSSVSVPANATYKAGQNLNFTVNFNENVTVDTTGGPPFITVVINGTNRQAAYVSGSGTSALVFRYTVQAGDGSFDGIGSAILANGGTLCDATGNGAYLTLLNTPTTAEIYIDTTEPTATVSISETYFYSGDTATVTIIFSEVVTGFTLDDLTVSNGSLTGFTGDGITFTATFTADNVNDDSNTIDLNLEGVTDAAGNTGSGTVTSANYTIITPSAPGAPTNVTAIAGNGQATVTFTAPASDGGRAITGYTVIANPGGLTGTGAGSPITVIGLTNGVAYTFSVTAMNSVGLGTASSASNSVTPRATQTINFNNPGAQNFGTNPTLTATSSSGLTVTFTSESPEVCTVTSGGVLTFIKAGTATIKAHQAGDASYLPAAQISQSFTVNAIQPGAPTGVTAIAGDTQAIVSFTAPASTGGAAITGYTITVNPADVAPVNGATSPIVVTGLTNGQAYTFTVTATNSAGTGTASAASNSVTPRAAQTIIFNNPGAQNFGTSPTLTATSDSGLTPTFTTTTPGVCVITSTGNLTFISAGSATIIASQAGNGSYLPAASVSQTFTVNAIVPGAPTAATATAGDTQASVSFTAPASTGGTAITGYTVAVSPAVVAPVNGTGSPIVVTGLTNGQAYTFTVTAMNSVGPGTASSASNSVTLRTAQTITFNNPGAQNFGTSPTLTATSSSGLTVTFNSETPEVCTVTSGGVLTFIRAGTATITANQAGDGSYLPAAQVSQSFNVSAIVPVAPTGVTATAGNAQASVSFSAPVSNGGASITGYTVTSSPGGFTATGTGSPITVNGLTNGVAYTFTVTATNSAGTGTASAASSSVMPQAPVYDNTQSTPSTNSSVVEVNGERQDAGASSTTTTDGQTVTTITVDGTKLDKILESSGEKPTVTLPSTGSAVIVGELNGQTVKIMENKEATLVIKTDTVTYTLPASQINIDAVSALLGSQVELKDIKVNIMIAEPATDTVRIVEDTANRSGYQLVVKPVEFEITCTNGDQIVEVSRFNGYVERTIAIPDGIDPSKITTGIILNADGTFSHVPTQIIVIDGKYYAKINSLTNSVYSVVYNPVTFMDVSSHWAEVAINDMGSRMIVNSLDSGAYEPNRNITRAEFAAIVVKALGLEKGTTESPFDDVTQTDWFNGYVYTATAYNLITGYDSESFAPNDIITREQAMTILARAMKLTGISVTLTESEVAALLANYTDAGLISDYARAGVAACIKTAVVSGTTASTLSPKDSVTRAEVATMIQRLLLKSELI